MSNTSKAIGGLIQSLFSGPLDIVGDVHGEIDALHDLMGVLGYLSDGTHPAGRRLIFIGDLTDRGPDSPAVLELVSDLVSRGLAQCLLGNHELNLLREAIKEGNGWYFDVNHDRTKAKFLDSRSLAAETRPALREFLAGLPIALEREDLRLVHAAWHPASVETIRSTSLSAVDLYLLHQARAVQLGVDIGMAERACAEGASLGGSLADPNAVVPLLASFGTLDALHQDANPVSIVTSGLERLAKHVFFASGKWRMVDRYPWWNDYEATVPVIIGHYWRWPNWKAREDYSRGEPDLFGAYRTNEWFGAKKNVFCVDFAVGARFKERAGGATTHFQCRLGAVRWPERELVMDDGTKMEMKNSTEV